MFEEKYNILFGPKGDERIKEFIKAVVESREGIVSHFKRELETSKTTEAILSEIKYNPFSVDNPVFNFIIVKPMNMMNGNYGKYQHRDRSCSPSSIHPEWGNIILDIILYINKISLTSPELTEKKQIIDMIKEIGKERVETGKSDLKKKLVRALFTIYRTDPSTGAPVDITNDRISWVNTTDFKLNPNAFFNLLGNPSGISGPIRIPAFTSGSMTLPQVSTLTNCYNDNQQIIAYILAALAGGVNMPSGETESLIHSGFGSLSKDILSRLDGTGKEDVTASVGFFTKTGDIESFRIDPITGVIIDKDGKKVDISYIEDLLVNHPCKVSGGIGQEEGKDKCIDYIKACLKGRDIEKCAKFLESVNFRNVAKEEIKNLLPGLLKELVETLKIPKHRVYSTVYNSSILQLKSSDVWVNEILKSKLTDAEVTNIVKNKHLMAYIQYVISFINSHPKILNPNIVDTINKDNRKPMGVAREIGMNAFGGPSNMFSRSDLAFISESMYKNKRGIQELLNSLTSKALSGILSGGGPQGDLKGGKLNYNLQEAYENIDKLNPYRVGELLERQYNLIKKVLNDNGKQIVPADDIEITKYIDKLKDSETNLVKTLYSLREFIKIMNNDGPNSIPEVFNLDTLEEIVQQTTNKVKRVDNKRDKVLKTILDLYESTILNK